MVFVLALQLHNYQVNCLTDLNAFIQKLDARRQVKSKGKFPHSRKRRVHGTPKNSTAPHGLPRWMVRVGRVQSQSIIHITKSLYAYNIIIQVGQNMVKVSFTLIQVFIIVIIDLNNAGCVQTGMWHYYSICLCYSQYVIIQIRWSTDLQICQVAIHMDNA